MRLWFVSVFVVVLVVAFVPPPAWATLDQTEARSIAPYKHGINRRHNFLICVSEEIALKLAKYLNGHIKDAFKQCGAKKDKKCEKKVADYMKSNEDKSQAYFEEIGGHESCEFHSKGKRPIHFSMRTILKADRKALGIPDGVTTEGTPQEGLSVLAGRYWSRFNTGTGNYLIRAEPSRYIVTFVKVDEPEGSVRGIMPAGEPIEVDHQPIYDAKAWSEGADINTLHTDRETFLYWAVKKGEVDIVKALLDAGVDVNAQLYAGADTMKILLAAGADINAQDEDGKTPLHGTVRRGYVDGVIASLKLGAYINARDKLGLTPLHEAVWLGNVDIIEVLLAAGADVNAQDKDGLTPLHEAVWLGNVDIIEVLLAEGADINARDKLGLTPLHVAAEQEFVGIMKPLLDAGADVDAKNNEGKTVLDIIRENRRLKDAPIHDRLRKLSRQ